MDTFERGQFDDACCRPEIVPDTFSLTENEPDPVFRPRFREKINLTPFLNEANELCFIGMCFRGTRRYDAADGE